MFYVIHSEMEIKVYSNCFQWKDFCKGLLAEARWYHNGYTPGLHEYLDNGWVTSCGPLLSIHTVFWDLYERQEEAINFLKINRDLVYNTSMIIRLCNDQGTSKVGYILF